MPRRLPCIALMSITRAQCAARDAADPLAFARARFALPPGVIYLDGNSLGALPRRTAARVGSTLAADWGDGLIRSWNDAGWFELPVTLGARIARLLGAAGNEVVACDSVSVNIFKLAAAALTLRPGRRVLLVEAGDFPTDAYVLDGLAALAGAEVRRVPVLADALGDDVALVLASHVHFSTGAVHDMAALTRAAQAAGALTLWDLSHSAGALAVDLNGAGADFAVGCGYKFLNGGPGAPGFAFAAQRHFDGLVNPLSGWFGHAAPFAFEPGYRPAEGVRRLLAGTPPVLALKALEAGVATFDGIDLAVAAAKSRALGDLFLALMAARCPEFAAACPADGRGAQVTLAHPDGYAVMQALIARGVIGDFRPPDRLRFGFPALYTRFVDVWDAVEFLARVMASGEWGEERFSVRAAVT